MANLAPPLKFTAWDSSGNPLAGGKLYTYVAGTTTPKATYTDSGLGTPNANPVILNSRGEASVWLSGAYQLVLKDASDVTIYSQDNVTDALTNSTISGTLTISSTAVTWSGNPTHSGNHTFSGNLSVQGNTALGNAGTDTVTTNGNVTVSTPTAGDTITAGQVAGSSAFIGTASLPGSTVQLSASNTSASANSDARMTSTVNGASGGDPYYLFSVSGVRNWGIGVDNDDSDTFKIDSNGILTTSSNWLNVTTNGRLYGIALHNNAGAVTGTTNQYIARSFNDNTTITATAGTNVSSTGTVTGQWVRDGNVVYGTLNCANIDPTSASVATTFTLNAPISGMPAGTTACSGTAVRVQTGSLNCIAGSVTGGGANTIQVSFLNDTDTAARDWVVTFMYTITS